MSSPIRSISIMTGQSRAAMSDNSCHVRAQTDSQCQFMYSSKCGEERIGIPDKSKPRTLRFGSLEAGVPRKKGIKNISVEICSMQKKSQNVVKYSNAVS
jgi:hypothetical protein